MFRTVVCLAVISSSGLVGLIKDFPSGVKLIVDA